MKTIVKLMALAGVAISALAFAADESSIAERLEPAGSLCMAGDDCASASMQVAQADGPRSGQQVYDTKCATCHATGAAGAPKLGDAAAWSSRIEKGMDTLYANAINGIGGMPAKGLCFDCSDDEIKASVDYMVDNSQ